MPAQLSLKVHVADMGTTKTMQFPSDMSIHDACHDIRQKLGEGGGGVDHGLFWPEHLKWLAPGRTFEYYDMKSGENLDFKKRHRLLRVKTTDETLKTIIIDETLTVAELVMAICERIGNPGELPGGNLGGTGPRSKKAG
ncbi:MAG: hypothetical protein BJ554DRAFT_2694 [Olpidium bornovanus]|uniref:Talin N-terminal F0 domain-containing protein n=1 Tax=Olpidium bornovanus TaxID=278681 RepID=A0A8H8DGH1_9FUNG|nr:MAG: hypothetical protein BJ554DRAFT_2694 [Olpidium bornovanus]